MHVADGIPVPLAKWGLRGCPHIASVFGKGSPYRGGPQIALTPELIFRSIQLVLVEAGLKSNFVQKLGKKSLFSDRQPLFVRKTSRKTWFTLMLGTIVTNEG